MVIFVKPNARATTHSIPQNSNIPVLPSVRDCIRELVGIHNCSSQRNW